MLDGLTWVRRSCGPVPLDTEEEPCTQKKLRLPSFPRSSPQIFDAHRVRIALGGFLAGYSDSTRDAYALDLRQWVTWCAGHDVEVFAVRRAHIELFARSSTSWLRSRLSRCWSAVRAVGCSPVQRIAGG